VLAVRGPQPLRAHRLRDVLVHELTEPCDYPVRVHVVGRDLLVDALGGVERELVCGALTEARAKLGKQGAGQQPEPPASVILDPEPDPAKPCFIKNSHVIAMFRDPEQRFGYEMARWGSHSTMSCAAQTASLGPARPVGGPQIPPDGGAVSKTCLAIGEGVSFLRAALCIENR
jgi:hypothetical protein